MKKIKVKDILLNICISFTIITLIGTIIRAYSTGVMSKQGLDNLLNFFWTTIAVCVLSLYKILERIPLGFIIIIQYVISITLVMLNVWVIGQFVELAKSAYRDAFITFTIPFIIGTIAFYIDIWLYVKKQNKMLEFIKNYK